MKSKTLLLLALLVVALFLVMRRETFTSPGTMVQLATSHVPTAEDEYYLRNIYPQIVRRDLIDMTGSA